jgi:iron complex outermembrane receptor protein
MNRVSLSESFQAFLGGRYDRIGYDDPVTSTVRDYCRFSPMAGLVVSPALDLAFYVNAGTAFAPPSTRVVGPREPEESRQIEAGVKKYAADNRLHAALAVYHLERDHIGIPDATGVTKQEGDQRSRGLELDVMMRPVPSWHTFVSYGYSDAKLTRFAEMVPVMTPTGMTFQHVDRSGNRPAFSPRHILNAWTAKGFGDGFEIGVGLRYVSSHSIAEDNRYRIGDVLTFDASASYTRRWMKFQINVRNLTDRKYETRGFGSTSVIPAHPFGLYGTCQIEL